MVRDEQGYLRGKPCPGRMYVIYTPYIVCCTGYCLYAWCMCTSRLLGVNRSITLATCVFQKTSATRMYPTPPRQNSSLTTCALLTMLYPCWVHCFSRSTSGSSRNHREAGAINHLREKSKERTSERKKHTPRKQPNTKQRQCYHIPSTRHTYRYCSAVHGPSVHQECYWMLLRCCRSLRYCQAFAGILLCTTWFNYTQCIFLAC